VCNASVMQLASSGGTGEEVASAAFATPDVREGMGSEESSGQSNSPLSIPKQSLALLVWPLCFAGVFCRDCG